MTKSFRKNIRRTITQSLGRYLAIFAIIALGVGFFAGLKSTKPAMLHTADQYLKEQKMYDFKVLSTIGFTKEEIDEVSELPNVSAAEGAVYSDILCVQEDGNEIVLRSHSITEAMNLLRITAGRMPTEPNECVVDSIAFGEDMIGKKIKLSETNLPEDSENFKYQEYTVVGIASSPLYMNNQRGTTTLGSGTLGGFMYLPLEGFEYEYFSEMYITSENTYEIYSDEYTQFVDNIKETLEPEVKAIVEVRYNDLMAEATEKITDAEKELEESRAESDQKLADAKDELEEAKKKLDDAKAELDASKLKLDDAAAAIDADCQSWDEAVEAGWNAYEEGKAEYDSKIQDASEQLDSANQQLEASKKEYQAGLTEYKENKAKYDAGYEQYQQGYEEYQNQFAQYESMKDLLTEEQKAEYETQFAATKAQLEQTKVTLNQTKKALAEAKAKLDAANEAIKQGEQEYKTSKATFETEKENGKETLLKSYNSLKQLESGIKAYEDGLSQYEEGVADYEEGKQTYLDSKKERDDKIAEAEESIQEAKDELADMSEPECYVFGRESNSGYSSFDSDAQIVEGVSRVFPVFFFLIAALVCSTTMTRMIDDERTQIGTFFALGYNRGTILTKYLIYSGSAALIGCLTGFFVGVHLFPIAIWHAYQMLYKFAPLQTVILIPLLLISIVVSLLCSIGTTYAVCRNELRHYPAELIRPKAPDAGKRILLERIGFIWKHMKFIHKVSARNIFRFKKRMFMMILGISGCTALVLTGFGISDSVANIANYQFGDIMKYDIATTYNEVLDSAAIKEFETSYGAQVDNYTTLLLSSADVNYKKVTKSVYLVATDDETIETSIHFFNGDHKVNYPGDGEILITQKLAELMDVSVGDKIQLAIGDESAKLTVSDITENYVHNYVYINAATYEEALGLDYEPKTMYVTVADGTDEYSLAAQIGTDEVTNVLVTQDIRNMVDNMMNSLDFVVVLVIACAAALAFVVLFNLGNINIAERVREIATIKVLGFHSNETGAYVFRENLVLSIMGIIVGLPLGVLLHRFVMSQIKIDMVAFKVIIAPSSYVYAALTVLAFTKITDLIMRRKINKIDMTESLKSIE